MDSDADTPPRSEEARVRPSWEIEQFLILIGRVRTFLACAISFQLSQSVAWGEPFATFGREASLSASSPETVIPWSKTDDVHAPFLTALVYPTPRLSFTSRETAWRHRGHGDAQCHAVA